MTATYIICIASAWLLGGFVHGVTSIGGSMIAMPVMTYLVEPKAAILIACMTGVVIPLALAFLYRRHILVREVFWLSLGCIPGIPAGTHMLTTLSGPVLLLAVSGMLIFFVLWQALSRKVRASLPYHAALAFGTGVAGSFLTACTGLGGPVMAVYAAFRGWEKEKALASTSMYFNCINVGMISLQWKAGLYTPDILSTVAISLPCALIGVFVSMPVIRYIDQQTFRKILLVMIFVSALVMGMRALSA